MKSRYTVSFQGREWTVHVEGDAAWVEGREVRLRAGPIAGVEEIVAEGRSLRIVVQPQGAEGLTTALVAGKVLTVKVLSDRDRLRSLYRAETTRSGPIELRSEIPGVIRKVFCQAGDPVEAGEPIFTLEAMKMENEVRTDIKGNVTSIEATPGQKVNAGQILAVIEPA